MVLDIRVWQHFNLVSVQETLIEAKKIYRTILCVSSMLNAYRDDYLILSFVYLSVHFCAHAKWSVKTIKLCPKENVWWPNTVKRCVVTPNMLMLSGQTASNVFERTNILKCLKKVWSRSNSTKHDQQSTTTTKKLMDRRVWAPNTTRLDRT